MEKQSAWLLFPSSLLICHWDCSREKWSLCSEKVSPRNKLLSWVLGAQEVKGCMAIAMLAEEVREADVASTGPMFQHV